MEEDVRDKLRDIFDVCDEDKEGFITIDHFKNLAKEHFGTESDGQVSCDRCRLDHSWQSLSNQNQLTPTAGTKWYLLVTR